MSTEYLVEALSLEKHRVAEFVCEEPELTEFLQNRALTEMSARASVCFVLVPKEDSGKVAGFYTLSSATISLGKLPSELAGKMPQYPNLPATLLGRLARDQRLRGEGLGELLLASALRRAINGAESIGSIAMVTDPKGSKAAGFYRKHGFRELETSRRMYLPMAEIAAALND